MTPSDLPWLAVHHEEMLNTFTGVTGLGALGVVVFVMQCGGHRRIEDHLRARCAHTASEARGKIKRGLALRDGEEKEEAHCVDSLIAGLDEWRRHADAQARRSARIMRAKTCIYSLLLVLFVAWVARFATVDFGWVEAGALLLWVVPFLIGVVAVWPVALELFEHGIPRDGAELPDPKALPQPAANEQIVPQTEAVRSGPAAAEKSAP